MKNVVEQATVLAVFMVSLIVSSESAIIVMDKESEGRNTSQDVARFDFLTEFVDVLADAELINKDDIHLYGRQARSNPLSELALDVIKELVSQLVTSTVGSFFGVDTERTDEPIDFISMILAAVRKSTLQKRMGCPT